MLFKKLLVASIMTLLAMHIAVAQAPNVGNSGSDDMTLSAGGSEHMRILSTGNIGIGTASPTITLDIAGAIKIANDATACTAGVAGAIRYNAGTVEYCNGTAWGSISAGALPSGTNGQLLQHDGSNWVAFNNNQTASSIKAGWPDAIFCENESSGEVGGSVFYLDSDQPWQDDVAYYRVAASHYITFNPHTGAYKTNVGVPAICLNKNIATLISENRTFNFIGTNGSQISLTTLADVSATTPTDGQVLTWSNANSRWEAADSTGGSGGSSTATTMVTGWPDVVVCNSATSTYSLYLRQVEATQTTYADLKDSNSTRYLMVYNSDGSYKSNQNNSTTDCVTNTWSISQLYSNNKAFNFVGSNGAGSSMVAGWPDAMQCGLAGGDKHMYYYAYDSAGGNTVYRGHKSDTNDFYIFTNAGAYSSKGTNASSGCESKSISTIISENRTFNFIGGSGAGATAVAGLTDVSSTTPTDGQVLTWDDSVKSWKPADSSGGSGGGSGTASTAVSGFPDAIKCSVLSGGNGTQTGMFYLTMAPGGSDNSSLYNGRYVYMQTIADRASNHMSVVFNADGSHYEDSYGIVTDCATKSISQLYTDGVAFNFVGSNGAGSSMVSGWPDAILCTDGSAPRTLFPVNPGDSADVYYRVVTNSGGDNWIRYNSSGVYQATSGLSGTCVANSWSISDLYTQGRAFNFIGGSGAGTTAVAGLTDVSSTTPTDGQVLSWNDSVKSWQPATAASGLPSGTNGQTLQHDGSNWVATSSNQNANTMTAGWPDAIVCNVTNPNWGQAIFVSYFAPYSGDGKYYYKSPAAGADYNIVYNNDGTFSSYQNITTTDCNVNVSTLYTNGNAFNFVGGNGVDTSLTMLADVSASAVTDGQILAWNNANSAWEPTAQTADEIGTLTNGKWCTSDGTTINCTDDAPSGGGGSTGAFQVIETFVVTDGTFASNANYEWPIAGVASDAYALVVIFNKVGSSQHNYLKGYLKQKGKPDSERVFVDLAQYFVNYGTHEQTYIIPWDPSGDQTLFFNQTEAHYTGAVIDVRVSGAFTGGGGGGGASSITALNDVSDTTPTDGQVLSWNDSVKSWQPTAAPSGLPSGINGQTLQHNGSNWVASSNNQSASTVIASWPDAIMCDVTSGDIAGGKIVLNYAFGPTTSNNHIYSISFDSTRQILFFNLDGSYSSVGGPYTLSGCISKNISTLYAEGRAFNFVGGNGSDISLTTLADVSATTPTDGQVLAWSNANSRWEAAAAASGLPSGTNGQTLQHDGSNWVASSNNQSASTILAGWPDAIKCSGTGGDVLFSLTYTSNTTVHYLMTGDFGNSATSSRPRISFQISDGTQSLFDTTGGWSSNMTDCSGKTIAQLYTDSQAFNFVGGGSAGGSGWETVSTSDTADFNSACHYRADLGSTDTYYYPTKISASELIFASFSSSGTDFEYRMQKGSKGSYSNRQEGSSSYGSTFTNNSLQKNCGGGNGGASITAVADIADVSSTTPTDGQVLTWDDSVKSWKPADATGGSGGSSSASTVYANFPDRISCSGTSGTVFFDTYMLNGTTLTYRLAGSEGDYAKMEYNPSGSQTAHTTTGGFANFMTSCSGKTIAQLYTDSQAFNFVGTQQGGSGNASMVAGWPDSLICTQSGSTYLMSHDSVTAAGVHRYNNGQEALYFTFNSDGSYNGMTGFGGTPDCQNKSISTLVSEGKAFNFIGGSGAGATAVAGLTDVSSTTPTDGQVLTWDDSVKSWKPADATGGSGGSSIASTMVGGWPDAMKCAVTSNGTRTFILTVAPNTDGKYYYRETSSGSTSYGAVFNSDGSFSNYEGYAGGDCNKTISQLYTDSQAFNFVGTQQGGSGNASMVANFPDAIICDSGTSRYTIYPRVYDTSTGYADYRLSDGSTFNIRWNNDGSFRSNNGFAGYTCLNKTITQLYTDGQAFNFIDSAGASTVGGLKDVSSTTPTDGQTLTWDDSVKSWKPAGGRIAFRVHRSMGAIGASSNALITTYTSESFDFGDNFNTTTGLFTAPSEGLYSFVGHLHTGSGSDVFVSLLVNGSLQSYGARFNTSATNPMSQVTDIFYLNAGDTVGVGATVPANGSFFSRFSGYKIN